MTYIFWRLHYHIVIIVTSIFWRLHWPTNYFPTINRSWALPHDTTDVGRLPATCLQLYPLCCGHLSTLLAVESGYKSRGAATFAASEPKIKRTSTPSILTYPTYINPQAKSTLHTWWRWMKSTSILLIGSLQSPTLFMVSPSKIWQQLNDSGLHGPSKKVGNNHTIPGKITSWINGLSWIIMDYKLWTT